MVFMGTCSVSEGASDASECVQVIYGLYSAAPTSLWFNPERPLVFAMMACLVLGLSVAAATLLKGFLAIALNAAHSIAAREPSSPKQDTAKLTGAAVPHELIEMHARAVEVHSPLSPASAMLAKA